MLLDQYYLLGLDTDIYYMGGISTRSGHPDFEGRLTLAVSNRVDEDIIYIKVHMELSVMG